RALCRSSPENHRVSAGALTGRTGGSLGLPLLAQAYRPHDGVLEPGLLLTGPGRPQIPLCEVGGELTGRGGVFQRRAYSLPHGVPVVRLDRGRAVEETAVDDLRTWVGRPDHDERQVCRQPV